MAQESSEVRSFGTGKVYVNENLTAGFMPEDVSTPLSRANGWVELGHLSDAGPQFSFGKSRTPVRSWQSYPNPVRNLRGESITTVTFTLLQWNRFTVPLSLGGGTWADLGGGEYRFDPADSGATDERAVVIEGTDDDYTYRFLFYKAENQAATEFAWTGTTAAPLPVQMTVLQPDASVSSLPYRIFTDDPNAAIAEAAS